GSIAGAVGVAAAGVVVVGRIVERSGARFCRGGVVARLAGAGGGGVGVGVADVGEPVGRVGVHPFALTGLAGLGVGLVAGVADGGHGHGSGVGGVGDGAMPGAVGVGPFPQCPVAVDAPVGGFGVAVGAGFGAGTVVFQVPQ